MKRLFTRLFAARTPAKPRSAGRRLGLESLEGRVVLSAAPLLPASFATGSSTALFAMQATDMKAAQAIFNQAAASAPKQTVDRWKAMQQTQEKIFQVAQEVTVNKMTTVTKAMGGVNGYIR